MGEKIKILAVGQIPPPYHGQAVVNQMIFDASWEAIDKIVIPMRYSKSVDDVGKAGLSKIFHLFLLVVKTWWVCLVKRPDILYYPPASAHKVPIIRDIVYLGLTRFFFKKTVFHFHAGGIGAYIETLGFLGKLAKCVYAKPDLAIELYEEPDSPGEYLEARSIVTVPNGLEVGEVKLAKAVSKPFTILFLGALREDKGVLDLIRTVAKLEIEEVDVLIGGAWSCTEFEIKAKELTKELGVSDVIKWLGVVVGEKKWEVFNKADCFFFPTFYYSEKFPLVLIEALGMGLPIVSTNWRGIPQLLEGGDCSELFEVGDIDGFSHALRNLTMDKERLQKLSRNATCLYENKYTVQIFLDAMESCLLKVGEDI